MIPSSNIIIYLIIFFLLIFIKKSLLYNLYNYLFDKNSLKQKRVILYLFNEKTQNYIKNSKNYNFSVKGIINEKLKFYNTTSSNFEIDFNNINMFLKKHRITDILVSDRNSYKKKFTILKNFKI